MYGKVFWINAPISQPAIDFLGLIDWTDTVVLTFPSSNGFDCFEPGDVVQLDEPTNIAPGDTVEIRISGQGNDQIDIAWDDATVAETLTLFNMQNGGDLSTFPGNQAVTSFLYKFNEPTYGLEFMSQDEKDNNQAYWVLYASNDGVSWTEIVRDNRINNTNSTRPGIIKMGNNPHLYWKVSHIRVDDGNFDTLSYWYYGWRQYDIIRGIKVISKDKDANPPTITVDGGDWTGSDGSGTPGEQTTLVKETPYDTKLTVDGSTDLADMTGGTIMTDGTGAPGPYTQTPYKLVTTDIENVDDTDPANVVLTFPGAVSTNPDLRYFAAGDEIQTGVKVISTGYPDSNTMVVDGGNWGSGEITGNPDWDERFTWSDSLEALDGSFRGTNPATNAFNGSDNTIASTNGHKIIRFTAPVAFSPGATLEIRTTTTADKNYWITVNSGTRTMYTTDGGYIIVPYAAGDEAAFIIDIENDRNSADTDLVAIRIGGKELVDAISPPGDDRVEYQTNGGQGEIISKSTPMTTPC